MNIIEKALRIALEAHAGQVRKSDNSPYIVHPYMVAYNLAKHGFEDEIVAVAFVHDVLEDVPSFEVRLRRELGEGVFNTVCALTEDKSLPWIERKKIYLENIRNGSVAVRMVALADKIHNIQSMLDAYQAEGDELWKKFTRGREDQLWFAQAFTDIFNDEKHLLASELRALFDALRKTV